jgi:hypothetical protein
MRKFGNLANTPGMHTVGLLDAALADMSQRRRMTDEIA